MIINSHIHFNTDENYFFFNTYTFKRFKEELDATKIDLAMPCLNPKIGILRCPNDCSLSCRNFDSGINNNLQKCNCESPMRHRPVIESINGCYVLRCKTCGTVILQSKIDPLRKYNIELIMSAQKYSDRIKPILYISLCESTIQKEINFYEENFNGLFCGYKFHPWTDQVSVKNIRIKTNYPILIHTGMRSLELAEDAITFAKLHPKNKIVIAHAAQLKLKVLEQIASLPNVYIDCCPSIFLYKHKQSCFESSSKLVSPRSIYYEALKVIGQSKILFGSDSPWGNTEDELEVIKSLNISEEVKSSILFKNALDVYF